MQTLSFTIRGNQEDPTGNPVPYTRVLNHSWRGDSKRYMKWLDYVRAEFVSQVGTHGAVAAFYAGKPPIVLGKEERAQVAIKVYWRDGSHGDLDNVLKGILDALFENDKRVNGLKASSEMSRDKRGRVEVIITLP